MIDCFNLEGGGGVLLIITTVKERERENKKSEWNLFNSFNPFDIVYRFLSISIDSPLLKTRINKKAFHPPPPPISAVGKILVSYAAALSL